MEIFTLYTIVKYNGPRFMDSDPEPGTVCRVLDHYGDSARIYTADKRKWIYRVPTATLTAYSPATA